MKSFKDATGKVWTYTIDLAANARVMALCKVNLYTAIRFIPGEEMPDYAFLRRFEEDINMRAELMYALCFLQADEEKISLDDFVKRLTPDILDGIKDDFMEELINFSPRRTATFLRQMIKVGKEIEAAAAEQMSLITDASTLGKVIEDTREKLREAAELQE